MYDMSRDLNVSALDGNLTEFGEWVPKNTTGIY